MKQEKEYLKALIEALRPHGTVLEIGFQDGFSSTQIQTFSPKTHTLIEPNPETLKEARTWAQNYPNVTVVEGTWEKNLHLLGTFDVIFCNDLTEEEASSPRQQGQFILGKGKETLGMVHKSLPELATLTYSDHDLDTLFEQIGQTQMQELSHFIWELQKGGQISPSQYERLLKKHHLESKEPKSTPIMISDPLFPCLQKCLKNHMREESRFSGFTRYPTSRYENGEFFEHIITNPCLDYQEEFLSTTPSETYPFDQALVMVIEKLGSLPST